MERKKRVTSYDVAKAAGVSQSAVSRVFRPGLSVSKKMKDKVLNAADELGYQPNAIARMLINNSSGLIAVIISSRANLNYPEILSLLNIEISKYGKRVLLFNLDEASELDSVIEQILSYRVDGVIALAAHFEESSISSFEKHDVPVVLYNRALPERPVSSVCVNHEIGYQQLVEKLHRCGHRQILIVGGPVDSEVANIRLAASVSALKRFDIDASAVVRSDYSYDSAREAVANYYATCLQKPTALLCANDIIAIGALDELREHQQLQVPADVSVVGFDGNGASQWFGYQLTTIRQPIEAMTKAAVECLINMIENSDQVTETRVFSGSLVEGGTIDKVRRS